MLGYLDPAYFAGGTLSLEPGARACARSRSRSREPLGLACAQAALGIHRVVNVQMAEGIRLVSISRGVDPRGFALVPFGGGGALHATALARELGIETIVVPRHPGVLCAAGLLSAAIEHEASAALHPPVRDADPADVIVDAVRAPRRGLRRADARAKASPPTTSRPRYYADVCYVGQAYHMEVAARPRRRLPR